jgi:hypothetical protein
MVRLPRLVASSLLRSWLCAALSAHLIYAPLFALPMTGATVPKPLPPALSLPVIKALHQAGEVLVKFRAEATAEQRAQVITRLAQDSRLLRGGSGVTRFKLNPGTDVPSALALLEPLDGVIEWAEPNYLVKRTADPEPRLSRSPNDPRFPEQWALRNTGRRGGVRGSEHRRARRLDDHHRLTPDRHRRD